MCWWVWGCRGPTVTQTPSSINAPICLTCRPLPSSLTMGRVFLPPPSLRKCSFWKVPDVNESSRTRSQGSKQRADEVSGLFMHCCHPLEGWPRFQATRELPGLVMAPLSGPDTVALPQGLLSHLYSFFSSCTPCSPHLRSS